MGIKKKVWKNVECRLVGNLRFFWGEEGGLFGVTVFFCAAKVLIGFEVFLFL